MGSIRIRPDRFHSADRSQIAVCVKILRNRPFWRPAPPDRPNRNGYSFRVAVAHQLRQRGMYRSIFPRQLVGAAERASIAVRNSYSVAASNSEVLVHNDKTMHPPLALRPHNSQRIGGCNFEGFGKCVAFMGQTLSCTHANRMHRRYRRLSPDSSSPRHPRPQRCVRNPLGQTGFRVPFDGLPHRTRTNFPKPCNIFASGFRWKSTGCKSCGRIVLRGWDRLHTVATSKG